MRARELPNLLPAPGATGRLGREQALLVLALVAVGVVGVSIFLAMPVVAAALSGGGFTDEQVGQFSSIQLFCISLGCAASLWLGPRFGIRSVARLALITLAAMDLLCTLTRGHAAFLAIRAVAGMAGGVMISTATAALGRTRSADRNFGWFLFGQILFQMVAAWVLPRLVSSWGMRSIFATFSVLEISVLLFLAPKLPAVTLSGGARGSEGNTRQHWLRCLLVLISILAFFTAVGAFWTFVGRIGETGVGLSSAAVGSALAIATLGGLIGAFVPVVLGTRLGRVAPMAAAVVALGTGLELMGWTGGFGTFAVATGLFSFGWFLLYPYQLGVLAELDGDGRPMILSQALTGAGLAIGPAIVVRLLPIYGLAAPRAVALASVAASAALIFAVVSVPSAERALGGDRR